MQSCTYRATTSDRNSSSHSAFASSRRYKVSTLCDAETPRTFYFVHFSVCLTQLKEIEPYHRLLVTMGCTTASVVRQPLGRAALQRNLRRPSDEGTSGAPLTRILLCWIRNLLLFEQEFYAMKPGRRQIAMCESRTSTPLSKSPLPVSERS